MPRLQQLIRPMALAMAIIVALVSLPAGLARAAMIPTDEVIGEQAASGERGRVEAFLLRDDVRAQMAALGVDGDEAALRVAGLSDAEVQQIAGYLDELPAGEGAVGSIIGAAVLIFLVLLLTDLLGLTNVFPFVRR
jgi:cytochrome c1